jgi:hypothetical protein
VIFCLKILVICKLWCSIWRVSWFVNCDILPELRMSHTYLYFCISWLHNYKLIVSKIKFCMYQYKGSSMFRVFNWRSRYISTSHRGKYQYWSVLKMWQHLFWYFGTSRSIGNGTAASIFMYRLGLVWYYAYTSVKQIKLTNQA